MTRNSYTNIICTFLKGLTTFWEFSFYRQKGVADYEYHSFFAKKIVSQLIFHF